MEEIEKLRQEVDELTARSYAQQALLLFLAQQVGQPDYGFLLAADGAGLKVRDRLRHSALTDAQISMFERELQRQLELLRSMQPKDHWL